METEPKEKQENPYNEDDEVWTDPTLFRIEVNQELKSLEDKERGVDGLLGVNMP